MPKKSIIGGPMNVMTYMQLNIQHATSVDSVCVCVCACMRVVSIRHIRMLSYHHSWHGL